MGVGPLSFTQAMSIAYDIKQNPQDEKVLTDYLSKEEKELVKVALKYLYASDKAMKTYWIKLAYFDSAIKAVDAQRNATSKLIKAEAQSVKTTGQFNRYQNLKASLDAKWASLTVNQRKTYLAFQKESNALLDDLLHAMKAATKNGQGLVLNSDIINDPAGYDINRYLAPTDPRAARDLKFTKESRIKLQKILAVESPGLARAVKWFYKRFDATSDAVRKAFDMPLHMGLLKKSIKQKNEEKWARIDDASKAAQKAAEASSKADEARKTLQIAGAWYIVAAMGDALTELAQNLAY